MGKKSDTGEKLYFLLVHKWKYFAPIILNFFRNKNKNKKKVESITYVARVKDSSWIFGAKVRRLSKYSSLKSSVHLHNKLRNLPSTDGYYYIYHNYFCRCLRSTPSIIYKKNIVMFTHPNWSKKYSKTHVVWGLNQADYVICLNSNIRSYLIECGVRPEILKVIHIATSDKTFYPHLRTGLGVVGLCSGYHIRKNPDLIFDIVKNLPERPFWLVGSNWNKYHRFDELLSLPNFTYFEDEPYDDFPALYEKMDVFLSPSSLEGGPVPLLEAMMSNCIPVASRTGFSSDIIEHGVNGYLFDVEATYSDVIPLIEKAFTNNNEVRTSVLENTWENCSKRIDQLFLEV
jgi:glycosyltransferase involved in cell wall biosynthesis